MRKCPNCGSNLRFDPKSQKVVCDSCDSSFEASELNNKSKKAQELEGKLYLCSQCGGEILSFDETAVTFCSYCDSQTIIESKMMKINNPELIIPFKMTMDKCIENYKKKIASALFVPDYMKSDAVIKKFRGIYMPYVICNASYHGPVSGEGERYSHRSGDYIIYNKYEVISDADIEYNGISYDLSSNFYDSYSEAIPFDYKDAIEYNPNYLLGYYADTKDVDIDAYDKKASLISVSDLPGRFSKIDEYRKYNATPTVKMEITDHKVGMYPVYFMSVKHKDKIHYAVVNGQTGKVAADLPISFIKYLFGTCILAIPIFLLLMFLPIILPNVVVILSIVAAFISMLLAYRQLKQLEIKEGYLDDIGYQQKNRNYYRVEEKEKNKGIIILKRLLTFIALTAIGVIVYLIAYKFEITILMTAALFFIPFGPILIAGLTKDEKFVKTDNTELVLGEQASQYKRNKIGSLYKQIIAIVIAITILIINPVDDLYYYVVALISFGLTLISFRNLIIEHNLLTSRKPPQLEKRGGDENE